MSKRRTITPLILFALLAGAGRSWAQTWSHRYDLPTTGRAVAQSGDGGYVVAGSQSSPSGTDILVLKVDALGNSVWQATFDSPGLNGLAQFISRTADGGFVVVGVLNGPGSSNALVLRLNDFGGLIWQKAFGGPYDDGLSSVRETSDGGFVLAGQFQPLGGCIACTDAWVLRLDGSGNLLWSKTYGGTDEDRLYEIEELPGGRFVAAGATRSSGAGAFDAFAILLDAGGNIVWQKTVGSRLDESAASLTLLSSGDIVLAGTSSTTTPTPPLDCDPIVIRLGSDGSVIWKKTYSVNGCGIANAVRATSDGGVVVTGVLPGVSGNDGFMMKLDGNGRVQWWNRYDGGYDQQLYIPEQATDSGYIVAGESVGSLWLQKTDALGRTGASCPLVSSISGDGKNNNLKVRDSQLTGPVTNGAPIVVSVSRSVPSPNFTELCPPSP